MEQSALLKIHNGRSRAIMMQIAAASLWSIGGMLIKQVDLNPIAIAGMRSLIASMVIFLFLKKSVFKLSLNTVLGAVSYACMVFLYVCATKTTTAANAIILQYTSPIYIAVFGGWLLHEKATKRDWITILFVITGMVLFFLDDISGGSLKGNVLAMLSGAALGFNTMFMRRQKDADPLENVFWGSILAAIISIPYMIQRVPSHKDLIGLLILGVFQLGIAYVFYSRAIKCIAALESTFISLIEPLLNPVWVFLTIGEIPGKLSIVGGVIVISSIVMSCIKPKKRIKEELSYNKAS